MLEQTNEKDLKLKSLLDMTPESRRKALEAMQERPCELYDSDAIELIAEARSDEDLKVARKHYQMDNPCIS